MLVPSLPHHALHFLAHRAGWLLRRLEPLKKPSALARGALRPAQHVCTLVRKGIKRRSAHEDGHLDARASRDRLQTTAPQLEAHDIALFLHRLGSAQVLKHLGGLEISSPIVSGQVLEH